MKELQDVLATLRIEFADLPFSFDRRFSALGCLVSGPFPMDRRTRVASLTASRYKYGVAVGGPSVPIPTLPCFILPQLPLASLYLLFYSRLWANYARARGDPCSTLPALPPSPPPFPVFSFPVLEL